MCPKVCDLSSEEQIVTMD